MDATASAVKSAPDTRGFGGTKFASPTWADRQLEPARFGVLYLVVTEFIEPMRSDATALQSSQPRILLDFGDTKAVFGSGLLGIRPS